MPHDGMVPFHLPFRYAKLQPALEYLESSPYFARPAMRNLQRAATRALGCLQYYK
jgi:hypothetical protein